MILRSGLAMTLKSNLNQCLLKRPKIIHRKVTFHEQEYIFYIMSNRGLLVVCLAFAFLRVSSTCAAAGARAIRSYPHRGAVKVNVLTQIGISYNGALDSSALADASITVTGSKYGIYSGSLALSLDQKTLIFKPFRPFL